MVDSKKIAQVRSARQVPAYVRLLDDEIFNTGIDKRAVGWILFDKVCEHLNILEKDYFGLTYIDPTGIKYWLNNDKKIAKQLKAQKWELNFEVKFYPPDPAQLAEDLTRYQLCLQIRRDIVNEKLPCSFVTYTLLGSYTAQSEIGDYDPEEFGSGYKYLKEIQFAPRQDKDLLTKIAELHRQHKGQTPEEAELHFLENAKKLAMYGVELHSAWDAEGKEISIGVSATGLTVYKDKQQINRFVWPKVLKISYRRNKYYIKIRPGEFETFASLIGFKLANVKAAKRLWKISVEHHSFFRFREPEAQKSVSILPRFGSRFRYSGRTQFQSRQLVHEENRDCPYFERVMSKRGTFAGRTTNMRKRDEERQQLRNQKRRQPPPGSTPESAPRPEPTKAHSEPKHPPPPLPSQAPPEPKRAPPIAPKPKSRGSMDSLDKVDKPDIYNSLNASFDDNIDRRSRLEKMHAVATPLAAMVAKQHDDMKKRDAESLHSSHGPPGYESDDPEDRQEVRTPASRPYTPDTSHLDYTTQELLATKHTNHGAGDRLDTNTQVPSADESKYVFSYPSSSLDSILSDGHDYNAEVMDGNQRVKRTESDLHLSKDRTLDSRRSNLSFGYSVENLQNPIRNNADSNTRVNPGKSTSSRLSAKPSEPTQYTNISEPTYNDKPIFGRRNKNFTRNQKSQSSISSPQNQDMAQSPSFLDSSIKTSKSSYAGERKENVSKPEKINQEEMHKEKLREMYILKPESGQDNPSSQESSPRIPIINEGFEDQMQWFVNPNPNSTCQIQNAGDKIKCPLENKLFQERAIPEKSLKSKPFDRCLVDEATVSKAHKPEYESQKRFQDQNQRSVKPKSSNFSSQIKSTGEMQTIPLESKTLQEEQTPNKSKNNKSLDGTLVEGGTVFKTHKPEYDCQEPIYYNIPPHKASLRLNTDTTTSLIDDKNTFDMPKSLSDQSLQSHTTVDNDSNLVNSLSLFSLDDPINRSTSSEVIISEIDKDTSEIEFKKTLEATSLSSLYQLTFDSKQKSKAFDSSVSFDDDSFQSLDNSLDPISPRQASIHAADMGYVQRQLPSGTDLEGEQDMQKRKQQLDSLKYEEQGLHKSNQHLDTVKHEEHSIQTSNQLLDTSDDDEQDIQESKEWLNILVSGEEIMQESKLESKSVELCKQTNYEKEQVPDTFEEHKMEQVPDTLVVHEKEQVFDTLEDLEVELVPDSSEGHELDQFPESFEGHKMMQVPDTLKVHEMEHLPVILEGLKMEPMSDTLDRHDIEKVTDTLEGDKVEQLTDTLEEHGMEKVTDNLEGHEIDQLTDTLEIDQLTDTLEIDQLTVTLEGHGMEKMTDTLEGHEIDQLTDTLEIDQLTNALEIDQLTVNLEGHGIEKVTDTSEGREIDQLTDTLEGHGLEKVTDTLEGHRMEKLTDTLEGREIDHLTDTLEGHEIDQLTDILERHEKVTDTVERHEMGQVVDTLEPVTSDKFNKVKGIKDDHANTSKHKVENFLVEQYDDEPYSWKRGFRPKTVVEDDKTTLREEEKHADNDDFVGEEIQADQSNKDEQLADTSSESSDSYHETMDFFIKPDILEDIEDTHFDDSFASLVSLQKHENSPFMKKVPNFGQGSELENDQKSESHPADNPFTGGLEKKPEKRADWFKTHLLPPEESGELHSSPRMRTSSPKLVYTPEIIGTVHGKITDNDSADSVKRKLKFDLAESNKLEKDVAKPNHSNPVPSNTSVVSERRNEPAQSHDANKNLPKIESKVLREPEKYKLPYKPMIRPTQASLPLVNTSLQIISGNLSSRSSSASRPTSLIPWKNSQSEKGYRPVSFIPIETKTAAAQSNFGKSRMTEGVVHMIGKTGWIEGGTKTKVMHAQPVQSIFKQKDDVVKKDQEKESQFISSLDFDFTKINPGDSDDFDKRVRSDHDGGENDSRHFEEDLKALETEPSMTVPENVTEIEVTPDILSNSQRADLLCRRVWTHTRKKNSKPVKGNNKQDPGKDDPNSKNEEEDNKDDENKRGFSGHDNQSGRSIEFDKAIAQGPGYGCSDSEQLDSSTNNSQLDKDQVSETSEGNSVNRIESGETLSKESALDNVRDFRENDKTEPQDNKKDVSAIEMQENENRQTNFEDLKDFDANIPVYSYEDDFPFRRKINLGYVLGDSDSDSSGSNSDSSDEIEIASFQMPHLQVSKQGYSFDAKIGQLHKKESSVDGTCDKADGQFAIDCSHGEVKSYKINESQTAHDSMILCECNFTEKCHCLEKPSVTDKLCPTEPDFYDFETAFLLQSDKDDSDENEEVSAAVPEVIDETPFIPVRSNLKRRVHSEPCLSERKVTFQNDLPVYRSKFNKQSPTLIETEPVDPEAEKVKYLENFLSGLFDNSRNVCLSASRSENNIQRSSPIMYGYTLPPDEQSWLVQKNPEIDFQNAANDGMWMFRSSVDECEIIDSNLDAVTNGQNLPEENHPDTLPDSVEKTDILQLSENNVNVFKESSPKANQTEFLSDPPQGTVSALDFADSTSSETKQGQSPTRLSGSPKSIKNHAVRISKPVFGRKLKQEGEATLNCESQNFLDRSVDDSSTIPLADVSALSFNFNPLGHTSLVRKSQPQSLSTIYQDDMSLEAPSHNAGSCPESTISPDVLSQKVTSPTAVCTAELQSDHVFSVPSTMPLFENSAFMFTKPSPNTFQYTSVKSTDSNVPDKQSAPRAFGTKLTEYGDVSSLNIKPVSLKTSTANNGSKGTKEKESTRDASKPDDNPKESENASNKTSLKLSSPTGASANVSEGSVVRPRDNITRYTYTINDDSEAGSPQIKTVTYEYITEYKLNNVQIDYHQNKTVQTECSSSSSSPKQISEKDKTEPLGVKLSGSVSPSQESMPSQIKSAPPVVIKSKKMDVKCEPVDNNEKNRQEKNEIHKELELITDIDDFDDAYDIPVKTMPAQRSVMVTDIDAFIDEEDEIDSSKKVQELMTKKHSFPVADKKKGTSSDAMFYPTDTICNRIEVEEAMERAVCFPLGPIWDLPSTYPEKSDKVIEEVMEKSICKKLGTYPPLEKKSLEGTLQDDDDKIRRLQKETKQSSQAEIKAKSVTDILGKGHFEKQVIEHNSEKYMFQSFTREKALESSLMRETEEEFENRHGRKKKLWTLCDEVDNDCPFEEYKQISCCTDKSSERELSGLGATAATENQVHETGIEDNNEGRVYSAIMQEHLPEIYVDDITNETMLVVQAMAVIALGTILVFILPYIG